MSSLEMVGSAGEGEIVVATLSPTSAQGKVKDGRRGKAREKREEDEKEGWNKKKMGSDYYGRAEQAPRSGDCRLLLRWEPRRAKRENYGLWGWRSWQTDL